MKRIEAIIKPHKFEEVQEALREAGVTIYAAPNLEHTVRTEPR